jgi:hypothetical protein
MLLDPNPRREVPIDAVSFSDDATIYHARLEGWCQPGTTVTPMARGLIAQALFALDEAERIKRLLAVLRAETERTAEIRWHQAREDEVTYYLRMFNQDVPLALSGLKRCAGGVRYLIRRWNEISDNLSKEGTLYGADRIECIQMQGYSAVIDYLYVSPAAWETFRDCLACQPNPKPHDIEMICAPDVVPKPIEDRELPLWRPDPEVARARLRAIVDRELPPLVALEAELRTHYEEPALAAAKALALAKLTREEAELRRALRSHEAAFLKATTALGKLQGQTTGADHGRGPSAALAAPPVCVDPTGPDARCHPPRRRVLITPPFARPRGPVAAAPPPTPAPSHYRNEAGATQVHGEPLRRDADRQAYPAARASASVSACVQLWTRWRPRQSDTGTKLTRRKSLLIFSLRRSIDRQGAGLDRSGVLCHNSARPMVVDRSGSTSRCRGTPGTGPR